MTLNGLSKEIHETAVEKGWWDENRNFGEMIALAHSELSEALEAWRKDTSWFYIEKHKPEGTAVELVDCIIRILDILGPQDLNIDLIMQTKLRYNRSRPHRHGGLRA